MIQTYNIDASHSQIGFKVRHLAFSKVRGRFEDFSGTIKMTNSDLESLQAHVSINATSVNTGVEDRDNHLRSADFFNVEVFPNLTFELTNISVTGGQNLSIMGNLTINDVTKPVELDAVYLGDAKDPWGGQRIAFEAQTKINRKDFGLTWNTVLETGGLLVGEDVEISLELEAVLQVEEGAALA